MAKARQTHVEESSTEYKQVISDLDGVGDALVVDNKDPGYAYYWATNNKHNPASVEALKRIGYEVVNQVTNSGEMAPLADIPVPDSEGAIRTDEHVLMRLPTHLKKYRAEYKQGLGQERRRGYEDEIREKIDRVQHESGETASGRKTFFFPTR